MRNVTELNKVIFFGGKIFVTDEIWDKIINFDSPEHRLANLFKNKTNEAVSVPHRYDIETRYFRHSPDGFISFSIRMVIDWKENVIKIFLASPVNQAT